MPKILVTRRTFPEAAEALRASGVEVVIWEDADAPSHDDLIEAVADVDEAIAHIRRYGSNHTDCIITEDDAAAQRFFEPHQFKGSHSDPHDAFIGYVQQDQGVNLKEALE